MLAPIVDLFRGSKRERVFFWIALGFFTVAIFRHQHRLDKAEAQWLAMPKDTVYVTQEASIAEFNQNQPKSTYTKKTRSPSKLNLFPFNPNQVSKNQLLEMNLPPHLVNNWIKFRNNGAKFYAIEDVKKIYGIKPYLSQLEKHLKFDVKPKHQTNYRNTTKPRTQNTEKLEINSCDTSDLLKVYGIGSILAKRIIKFRSKLGGFYAKQQLAQVYGLDSSVVNKLFQKFTLNPNLIQKIRLNYADENTLANHPYISKRNATLIVKYIQQHGPIDRYDDMYHIIGLKATVLHSLKPYVDLN